MSTRQSLSTAKPRAFKNALSLHPEWAHQRFVQRQDLAREVTEACETSTVFSGDHAQAEPRETAKRFWCRLRKETGSKSVITSTVTAGATATWPTLNSSPS